MADEDQVFASPVIPVTAQTAAAVASPSVADSDAVKGLLSIVDVLGDSLSAADRAKYEELIERARAQG